MAASCIRAPCFPAGERHPCGSAFCKPLPGCLAVRSPLFRGASMAASSWPCSGRGLPPLAALSGYPPFDLGQSGPSSLDSDSDSPAAPPPPGQRNKLFVGNLPWSVDSQQLAQVFQDIGGVQSVEVIYDKETGRSRGFAFIEMTTEEETIDAIERLDGVDYRGRKLRVNPVDVSRSGSSFSARYDNPLKIFVGNLPWSVDDVYLKQIFSQHGTVHEARVVYDRESGRSRGFGFVILSTEAEVNDAIASLDGSNIDGRPIRVNLASEKPASRF